MKRDHYGRSMFTCICGHVARSYKSEAYHRHNFPLLCKAPKNAKRRKIDCVEPGASAEPGEGTEGHRKGEEGNVQAAGPGTRKKG